MTIRAILRQITTWRRFAICQRGQDLIEYTLLLAFVALGIVAVIVQVSEPVTKVWNKANSHLEKAKEYAKGHSK
jgi:Flp pilus assembly pilin Flp